MTDHLVDREYLSGVQYASAGNLEARQAIYRFQQPVVRNVGWALDRAALSGEERVLDVGCGNGLYLGELARRGHAGEVVGMDLSVGILPAARLRTAGPLLVGDAQTLPFADRAFDRVLAMHMLYHVPDRDRALAEIARVLGSAGAALVLTNSQRHLEELNELIGSVVHDVTGAEGGAARAYLRFSSESGEAELRPHFATVDRYDLRSELVVTEPDAIVAYVASMGSVARSDVPANPILVEVERRARAAIEADGAFRIRTEVACFVCR